MRYCLRLLLLLSFFANAAAGRSALADEYLPAPYEWPEIVNLQEETLSYTPVSGSVVRGVMYSDDGLGGRSGFILLPNGLTPQQRLCFQVDARDGSYIGRGSLAAAMDAVSQVKFPLGGTEFRRLVRNADAASFLAWTVDNKDCSDAALGTLVPTSWSSTSPPVALRFLINSTGHFARIALRAADTQKYTTYECTAFDASDKNRVYDSTCRVPLCEIAQSDRILVEIRNRNQRIHLEEVSLSPVSAYCALSNE